MWLCFLITCFFIFYISFISIAYSWFRSCHSFIFSPTSIKFHLSFLLIGSPVDKVRFLRCLKKIKITYESVLTAGNPISRYLEYSRCPNPAYVFIHYTSSLRIVILKWEITFLKSRISHIHERQSGFHCLLLTAWSFRGQFVLMNVAPEQHFACL